MLSAALALTGCGGDDAPTAPSDSRTSASASPSAEPTTANPTVAPPTLPAEAQTPDAAGAEAFIRYYFQALDYAYRTGDLATVLPLRDEACVACKSSEETVAQGFENGGHIEGGDITVSDVTVTPGDSADGLEARVVLQQSAGTLLTETGSEADTITPSQDLLVGMILHYQAGVWSIEAWGKPDAPH